MRFIKTSDVRHQTSVMKTSVVRLQTSVFWGLFLLSSVVCCLMTITSCGVYSFTGASIPPEVKTVTVQSFGNLSENGNTAINQSLTDLLKNKFLTETNLKLINSGGDIEFTGVITGYSIRGEAPTGDETTAINRLTIEVKVDYFNKLDEK